MIVLPPYCKDYDTYDQLPENDRWIFNKLEICKRFGYNNYGPCGVPMPIGTYCIRPIINLNGMSAGGFMKKVITKKGTIVCKPGYVWTEWVTKPRSWVEYVNDNISSANIQVEWDERNQTEKFKEQPVREAHPMPNILKGISRYMLVEYLGDTVIDIGPRHLSEEPKLSIIRDYQNYDPSYEAHGKPGYFPIYMKRVQNEDESYSWEELDVFEPRKIYT